MWSTVAYLLQQQIGTICHISGIKEKIFDSSVTSLDSSTLV